MLGLGPNHKGWGPITRVGAQSPGLGPKRQGWGPIARVGHVQKNIVFRYKIQKKLKNLHRALSCNSK